MKTVTLGGDRLGSGKKQKITMHGFERSTHDLSYVWRNTQAPGTLVPFMVQLALPGDNFEIDLNADVKTHPTLGPLFASFKLQLDVFECPIRLYNSSLHNNKLNVGYNMESIKLPQIIFEPNPCQLEAKYLKEFSLLKPIDLQQINPSSIFAYLGMRGMAYINTISEIPLTLEKNAVPFLAYWDIFKNYYANKQEETAWVIAEGNRDSELTTNTELYSIEIKDSTTLDELYLGNPNNINLAINQNDVLNVKIEFHKKDADFLDANGLYIYWSVGPSDKNNIIYTNLNSGNVTAWIHASDLSLTFQLKSIQETLTNIDWDNTDDECYIHGISIFAPEETIELHEFPLTNIDDMRDEILSSYGIYNIDKNSISPFDKPLKTLVAPWSNKHLACYNPQVGLAVKTYQSDIFNNWINSEFIDGEDGINEIAKVSTEENEFSIDALNLAQKVYNMLNRIAVSGGSYEDWIEAVYDHQAWKRTETPLYHGGLSKEIIFQEVISTAETTNPLGTLAGRGRLSDKHKGGKVTISVNEPSYIIGIVSITPRIDYHQGNEFFTLHKTLNDLHVPPMDEIGFQDLVTDKMAWWDTKLMGDNLIRLKSAGKQPAWLDYMTNYNKLYGNFADSRNEMFMTLARNYESMELSNNVLIKDLTTYIDPKKYNYAFAQTDLTAMNFWVQIGCDITARRKMSAKIMPNI